MANSLLDRIQQNLGNLQAGTTQSTAGGGGGVSNTATAQRMMAARSGKAVGPLSSPVSSLAENAAQEQTGQQLQDVQQSASIQSAQLGQQSAIQKGRADTARSGLDIRRQQNELQNSLRTQDLLADLERDRGTLSMEKDRARMEQLATGMALQDRKYVDNLQREGARMRLKDGLAFDEQMARSAFGNNTALLKKYLGDQSALEMSDRDFQRKLGQMSIQDALAAARGQLSDARTARGISGAGSIATGAIGAASSYKGSGPKQTLTTDQRTLGNSTSVGTPASSSPYGSGTAVS